MCTHTQMTRHTLRSSVSWGKFSCLYLLSPCGVAGVTEIFTSASTFEVGSRNLTQVVSLAQHTLLPTKAALGSVNFQHGPLELACKHSKS